MWLLWVLGCVGPDPGPGDTAEPVIPPHNVLVLMLDDIGIERLPLYGVGETWATTPTLDSLAADGVSFRTVWAAPVCSPSRAAALTGRYAARTGFGTVNPPQYHWVLPGAEVTVPTTRTRPSASGTWAIAGAREPITRCAPGSRASRAR
jgi:hypothetical protein